MSPIIILLFAVLEYMYARGVGVLILKRVLPFVGILFILTVSEFLSETIHGKVRSVILFIGKSSLIIFLFHSAFGEFGKAILSLAGIASENHFALALLTFMLLDVCGPLLLQTGLKIISDKQSYFGRKEYK